MALRLRDDSESINLNFSELLITLNATQLYLNLATLTVLVYDALLTMDKEAKYFWVSVSQVVIPQRLMSIYHCFFDQRASPRKPVTIVYFLIRYIGILGLASASLSSVYNVSLTTCMSWMRSCHRKVSDYQPTGKYSQWALSIANVVIIVSIDYILMIRVLALYSYNKTLKTILVIPLCLEAILKFALVVYGIRHTEFLLQPVTETLSTCLGRGQIHLIIGIMDWVVPMAYGVLLMVLAVIQAAEYWRLSAGLKGVRLINVLIRDQAIYFLLAVICCVLNILPYKVRLKSDILSSILWQAGSPSFLSVLGSRMLFNLKEAAERGFNEGISYRVNTNSAMEFDRGEISEGSLTLIEEAR